MHPLEIQAYIKDNINAWIKDLPEPAKSVEEARLQGIEDETWWDDYRGAGQGGGGLPWSGYSGGGGGGGSSLPWSGYANR